MSLPPNPPVAGRVHILEDRSLKIDDITVDDMGEYSCEADNAVGSITASGNLVVHCEYSSCEPCRHVFAILAGILITNTVQNIKY